MVYSKYLVPMILLGGLLLAACGPPQRAVAPTPAQDTFIPVVAASELAVGSNRLPIGVLKNGTPINDPNLTLQLRFFYLSGNDTTKVQSEATTVYRGQGLPTGLYVAYPTLDRAGVWRMEVQIPRADGPAQVNNLRLEVQEKATTPSVGSPAIPSRNLTIRDKPDLKQLSSDAEPDPDLYQLSIADAVAAQKPFLVEFSTPGFCQTAVCGPNIQVIKQLKEQFKGQVNFIHVEVFPYPFGESFEAQRHVPAMGEWNLRTEPWTFLVDGRGIIQAKFEGGITFEEMKPALQQLAVGEPIRP